MTIAKLLAAAQVRVEKLTVQHVHLAFARWLESTQLIRPLANEARL